MTTRCSTPKSTLYPRIALKPDGANRWRVLLDGQRTPLELQSAGRGYGCGVYNDRVQDPRTGRWVFGPERREDCLVYIAEQLGVVPA